MKAPWYRSMMVATMVACPVCALNYSALHYKYCPICGPVHCVGCAS